eukprot:6635319-Prymnesium_polylepis.1
MAGELPPVGLIARACRQRLPRPSAVRNRQMAVTAALHPAAPAAAQQSVAAFMRGDPAMPTSEAMDKVSEAGWVWVFVWRGRDGCAW